MHDAVSITGRRLSPSDHGRCVDTIRSGEGKPDETITILKNTEHTHIICCLASENLKTPLNGLFPQYLTTEKQAKTKAKGGKPRGKGSSGPLRGLTKKGLAKDLTTMSIPDREALVKRLLGFVTQVNEAPPPSGAPPPVNPLTAVAGTKRTAPEPATEGAADNPSAKRILRSSVQATSEITLDMHWLERMGTKNELIHDFIVEYGLDHFMTPLLIEYMSKRDNKRKLAKFQEYTYNNHLEVIRAQHWSEHWKKNDIVWGSTAEMLAEWIEWTAPQVAAEYWFTDMPVDIRSTDLGKLQVPGMTQRSCTFKELFVEWNKEEHCKPPKGTPLNLNFVVAVKCASGVYFEEPYYELAVVKGLYPCDSPACIEFRKNNPKRTDLLGCDIVDFSFVGPGQFDFANPSFHHMNPTDTIMVFLNN